MKDVMSGSDGLGSLVILNKSGELRFGLRRSELIFRTWARPVQCGPRDSHVLWMGQWVESWRWTSGQHRKIVSISPRVENLNLKKVIKVSYLNQESRQCFVYFGIPYVYFTYSYLGPILNILQYFKVSSRLVRNHKAEKQLYLKSHCSIYVFMNWCTDGTNWLI